ncbi:hypothetical protein ES703_52518 [subsurface metagenome]
MRGVEKLQAAELHERDVATGEFDLQRPAVRGRTEKHRLLFEESPFLAGFENALDDVPRLVRLVPHRDEARFFRRGPLRPQVLGEALPREIDDAICRGKDRLRRTIVAVQGDDLRHWTELVGEVQDVTDSRGAEGIDRLRIVADHGEATASRLQSEQNR